MRFFNRTEWVLTAVILAMTVCQVWLDLEIPLHMSAITDVITSHGTSQQVMDESVSMIGCAVASLVVGLCISIAVGWVSSAVAKRIREAEFNRIQTFSFAEVDRLSPYSLVTRSTNDVKQVQDFIGTSLESLMNAPIISIWAILRISNSNLSWTAAVLTAIMAMVSLILVILRYTAPRYKRVQRFTDSVNKVTSEMLSGQRVIRAYSAEEFENRRFDNANHDLTDNNLKVNRIMSFNIPVNSLIRNSLTMAIYWIGAFIIAGTASYEGRLTLFSDMIVFATYSTMALNGFRVMVQIFNVFPRAKVSMERIFEILDTEPSIRGGKVTEGDGTDTVRFENVSFGYEDSAKDAVEDISFEIGAGETVAVIGTIGSGKSTLAKLLNRFYDVGSGSITVDGHDVREYDLDTLRMKIGYVSQKASLVSGSVRENVNYGRGSEDRSDEDIWDALRIACMDGFVEQIGGLDASVSEEGRNLSGGQKQRISIARAVCKKPRFYVFDDCFSALDFRTDLEIRRRLKTVTDRSTVLLVTQRIGTAMNADRILVMDQGRIVDQGTHADLMERCPLYREIADSQETEVGL
ncbi:MAG: ABC transporter ATP-binding protein/permease [archaeon]|nr:ABC transporter ATP-binding protein/permease [archaeon]